MCSKDVLDLMYHLRDQHDADDDDIERIYQEASEKPKKKFSKTTMAALRNDDESCDSSNVEGDEESITIEADLLAFDD